MSILPISFRPFWMEMPGDPDSPVERQGQGLLFFLGICGLAAFYASLYAPSESGSWGWYPRLVKPSWVPSASWTGMVSNVFYIVLAFGIWRVWRTGAFRNVPFTLAGFACLLFLQSIWSTLFYGFQSPLLGLADLLLIALLSGLLWLTYRSIDSVAGYLWLAYFAWILVLLPINASIWWLNG